MRYLAIDYGTKRIGLAVCDHDETIASPLSVLENQTNLPGKIKEIAKEQNIDALVLGLPLNMDGTEGKQARSVRGLSEELKKILTLRIHFQDERLTSYSAEDKLLPAELTEKQKRKTVNAVAAAEILHNFLENKKRRSK